MASKIYRKSGFNIKYQALTAALVVSVSSVSVQSEELRPDLMLEDVEFTGETVYGRNDLDSPLDEFNGGPRAHIDGAFTEVAEWPLGAIHSVLLPLGTVLTYGTAPDEDGVQLNAHGFIYDIWNPGLGFGASSHTTLDIFTETNLFCGAQVVLPGSGNVLLAGGDELGTKPDGLFGYGNSDSNIFNPLTNQMETFKNSMSYPRWYPTLATLANGEQIVLGGRGGDGPGSGGVLIPEIYNEEDGWRTLDGAESFDLWDYGWYYPRSFTMPNGKVLSFKDYRKDIFIIDPSGEGSVENIARHNIILSAQDMPALMYQPGKILTVYNKNVFLVELDSTGYPVITETQSLPDIRHDADATVLFDGTVMLNGGSRGDQVLEESVYEVDLWSPETGEWTRGAAAAMERLYHSSSLLLPNGAVLTAGGGPPGPVANINAEIYYPPYLFKKDGSGELADRPAINGLGAPAYGKPFELELEGSPQITKVVAIRTGGGTHSFDPSQRYIPLNYTQVGNKLTVQSPRDSAIATPGQYMVVVIDAEGVPSYGDIFQLTNTKPELLSQTDGLLFGEGPHTFNWKSINGAQAYDIRLGSTPGADDLGSFTDQVSLSHAFTLSGLSEGDLVHVQLRYQEFDLWVKSSTVLTYTEGNGVDTDGDGVVDTQDAFPNDPNESLDSDGDGVGDNADQLPNDANETVDSDGDGVGDNSDAFPNDAAESVDSDNDGVGDNSDAFPNDASETKDTDGDGVGDEADVFPNDPDRQNIDDEIDPDTAKWPVNKQGTGSVAQGEWSMFRLTEGSPGDSVSITLDQLTADLDLYIRIGDKPSATEFDCRSYLGETQTEVCNIALPEAGTETYIGVFGYRAGDYQLTSVVESSRLTLAPGESDSRDVLDNQWRYYAVEGLTEDDLLQVSLSALSADLDLYVKQGERPTLERYDCRSWNGDQQDESCQISGVAGETSYIGVYGYRAGSYTVSMENKETGGEVTGEALAEGDVKQSEVEVDAWKVWELTGTAGETLEVKLEELTADVDLYIQTGAEPTKDAFVCRSFNGGTKNEACTVTLTEDTAYVGVFGFKAGSFKISVETQDQAALIGTNESKTNTVPQGQWDYYRVDNAAALAAVEARLKDLNNDADLYIKKDSPPNLSDFDCRSFNASNKDEFCAVNLGGGSAYIGVYGYFTTEYTLVLGGLEGRMVKLGSKSKVGKDLVLKDPAPLESDKNSLTASSSSDENVSTGGGGAMGGLSLGLITLLLARRRKIKS